MRTRTATLGSAAFFLAAPVGVAGVIPWVLTRGRMRGSFAEGWPIRMTGSALMAMGVGVVLASFARFVTEGHGTPAPPAAPDALVVGGPNRWVRNPMYVAVVATIVGEALLLRRPVLLVDAMVTLGATAGFVHWYEEPELHRRFGARYDEYRRTVPGWWPRRPHA